MRVLAPSKSLGSGGGASPGRGGDTGGDTGGDGADACALSLALSLFSPVTYLGLTSLPNLPCCCSLTG